MMGKHVPGICARHAIVTNTCRENRGKMEAFDEAVRRLRESYESIVDGWDGHDVNFHVVLMVERLDPRESPGSKE